MSILAELQRRNVIRMSVAYLVFAWVAMQVLSVVGPVLDLPDWWPRLLLVLLALGFVAVVVFSWVYELTPEGIKRESQVGRTQSITHHTARKLDIAVIVLLGLSIALFAWDRYAPRPEMGTEGIKAPSVASDSVSAPQTDALIPSVPISKSIAVLPFVNMSSDPEQTYFSDGISEELLNALVKLPGLKVAGRTSSFAFRDKADDLRAIGKALSVNHILEGSVRKQGVRVRITAQLIEADDGFHVWSETYDREVTDIFALQDEITAAIVDALRVQLGAGPAPAATAVDIEAYNLYLKARQQLALRGVDGLDAARKLFEQSIALAPDYAPAHAGLARAASLLWAYQFFDKDPEGFISTADARRITEEAARRALALDPGNAEAWSVLGWAGMYLSPDPIAAGKAVASSLASSPRDPEIVNFAGDYYYWICDPRAEATERLATELDPLQAVNFQDLALVYLVQGRYQQALDAANAAQELGFYERTPAGVRDSLLPSLLGLGRIDDARALVSRMADRQLLAEPLVLGMHAQIEVAAGDRARAAALLDALVPYAQRGEFPAGQLAVQMLQAGLVDAAIPWLERTIAEGHIWVLDPKVLMLPERLPDHPVLRALLGRPEFNALFELRRRNLALPQEPLP